MLMSRRIEGGFRVSTGKTTMTYLCGCSQQIEVPIENLSAG